ncbi:MAG TPA: CHC2 zinc finger domain-containing protein [Polyangiaceae bacterium]|nr:CHC2 zinc finger domain-containing protein [Polyangiaceae bacterium]
MNEAAELRQALRDPRALCAALGIDRGATKQRGGRGLMILCPAHAEKTPSCSVTLGADGTIRVKCFGGCDFTGDALTLIAVVRGLDPSAQFGEVLREAAELVGVELPAANADPEPELERISPVSYNAITGALLDLCPLDADPDVLGYADRRVLLVQAGRAGCGGLPRPELQAVTIGKLLETFSAESLEQAGLLWRDDAGEITRSTFAHSENRLLVPWRALDGSITTLQRRRLDDWKPKYVFPPCMRPPLPFGAEQLRAHAAERVLVFVEGALDVLALRLLDWRDGLGILPLGLPGLDGWRADWARFAQGRAVRIGFDADAAGERKIEAVAADLFNAGAATVERWTPNAKDWCALVEQGAGARKERAL